MGYLEWHAKKTPEARIQFQKAFDAGSHNPRMLWDYGRMAQPEQTAAVFDRLIEDSPNRIDVRLELAKRQIFMRKPKEAAATLEPIKKVNPDEAPLFFRLQMQIAWETDKREDAKLWATRLLEFSKDSADQTMATQMLRAIENGAQRSKVSESDKNLENRPRIMRRTAEEDNNQPVQPPALPTPKPSAVGSFVELECAGNNATVVLKTESGELQRYLIDRPQKTVVRREGGGAVDLTCGRQKPASLRIEYELPSTPLKGITGLVRVLEFDAK